ncbi:MAG: YkgJ family cysteine cluster protein [Pseudomonadota bacterium]|nr:YkgJ family cysteine cluster protein [Pseudomonadota bacterium]
MTEPTTFPDPAQADLVARQAARWNDPATQRGARDRVALANERAANNAGRLRIQLKQLASAPAIKQKIYWLRELAATFADAVAPHAACAGGCAACCYQPVAVTREEAEAIAKETGARLQTPAAWSTDADMQHVGQACSFLQDSRCTIYQFRPIACRLMFNMDVDALLCQMVPGALSHVPYADYSDQKELYVRAHLGRVKTGEEMRAALKTVQMADLREFFPHGLRTEPSPGGPT